MVATPNPRLFVRTDSLKLDPEFSLLDHLPPECLTFIRDGEGLVGFGKVLELTATGENRIDSLSEQWKTLIVDSFDATPGPGRGLVAFGSISFSDTSQIPSRLVIPQQILGVRDGRSWLTRIDTKPIEADIDVSSLGFPWNSPSPQSIANPPTPVAGKLSPADFTGLVAEAVSRIQAGEFEKVVLARDLEATVEPGFDLRPALSKLARLYPGCWTYSVAGMFGASPELLVRVSHGQVSARVLAGTAGRGTDPGIDRAISAALTSSVKNKHEHKFALDSLVSALAPFCSQIDADPEPFSLALPNVWHLASDVHGVLHDNASALDLAAALHPTAAVAGTPTKAAQRFIDANEPFDRGGYAGPVGWIGADGDGEWAIALRGAYLHGQTITAFAGCGVVAESDPEGELAETRLKFQPIRQALS